MVVQANPPETGDDPSRSFTVTAAPPPPAPAAADPPAQPASDAAAASSDNDTTLGGEGGECGVEGGAGRGAVCVASL